MELILASASQRRRELMEMCGYEFSVIPSRAGEDIEEEDPAKLVQRLAVIKARSVFDSLPAERKKNAAVVGSDTVVVLDGKILGKPCSKEEAHSMLRLESGRENTVYTGLAVVCAGSCGHEGHVSISACCDSAIVRFAELTDEEIEAYISTGDPLDKAGAYGIQGAFSVHITGITGSYFTVVGLPVHLLYRELKKAGVLPRMERPCPTAQHR